MKMSQNPNGQIEVYSDEGIFMGFVQTQDDFLLQEQGERQEKPEKPPVSKRKK